MKTIGHALGAIARISIMFIAAHTASFAQSTLNCGTCHSVQKALWQSTKHGNTQHDVAVELAAAWKGQPADSVINGSHAENCIACHGPTSVATGGGMTEVQVMSHFFTTTASLYTDSTHEADTLNWPHVACTACHNVQANHPATHPTVALFNSTTAHYDSVNTSSQLCGHCHGSVRFADTDHRIFDAWRLSKHGRGNQSDIAGELAANWSGQTPDSVINGSEAENCIACHAPTAVNRKAGVTEVEVLSRFFTTTDGKFTSNTTFADTTHWPEVACNTCHNPHHTGVYSFFNTTTGGYQEITTANQLCGQCHGTLRFPETDHGSYDIELGSGGVGVPDKVTMPNVQCTDCHMHSSDVEGSSSLTYKGHSWSVFITETDGKVDAACTRCHAQLTAVSALAKVKTWQDEYEQLYAVARQKVCIADSVMQGESDTLKLRYLDEATHNLALAGIDESGGFHNHLFVVSLLNDAIKKANLIVTGVGEAGGELFPKNFSLLQNYPNPFNPSTSIEFELSKPSVVTLSVYDLRGVRVRTLANKEKLNAGVHKVTFDASNLSSGIYLYKLETPEHVQTRKMVLLK